jgi:hypothetical protein
VEQPAWPGGSLIHCPPMTSQMSLQLYTQNPGLQKHGSSLFIRPVEVGVYGFVFLINR